MNELVARGSHTKSVDCLTYIYPSIVPIQNNILIHACISRYVKLAWDDKKNIVDQLPSPSKKASTKSGEDSIVELDVQN